MANRQKCIERREELKNQRASLVGTRGLKNLVQWGKIFSKVTLWSDLLTLPPFSIVQLEQCSRVIILPQSEKRGSKARWERQIIQLHSNRPWKTGRNLPEEAIYLSLILGNLWRANKHIKFVDHFIRTIPQFKKLRLFQCIWPWSLCSSLSMLSSLHFPISLISQRMEWVRWRETAHRSSV